LKNTWSGDDVRTTNIRRPGPTIIVTLFPYHSISPPAEFECEWEKATRQPTFVIILH